MIMSKTYNYHLLANLNLHIRVERFKLIKLAGSQPIKLQDIPYSQVRLDESDMEDILERANAIADNVTVYYRDGANTLSDALLNSVRHDIATAISTLIGGSNNSEFINDNVTVLHESDESNSTTGLNSYVHTNVLGDYETKVYITYMPHIFSSTLIYPNRPGAIINYFVEMEY